MTIQGRATGWLDQEMHRDVREVLIHAAARHHLACPIYCLMPDHAHFLWLGLGQRCDQLNAARFFRKHWNRLLEQRQVSLQPQGYEHVLNESERNPSAFEDTCLYIAHNPQRAELVEDWREWKHLGAVVAGFPQLDPRSLPAFWAEFWKVHHRALED